MSTEPPDLSLTEWAVLGFVAEGETYGFSVAKLLAADGDAGRIWSVPRPLVYRAIDALIGAGLIREVGSAAGSGPRRTLIDVTSAGAQSLTRWLDEPIAHVRDARSHLLMKLLLIDRRGGSPELLVRRQREALVAIIAGLDRQLATTSGFDAVLLRWRRYSADALDRFLAGVILSPPSDDA